MKNDQKFQIRFKDGTVSQVFYSHNVGVFADMYDFNELELLETGTANVYSCDAIETGEIVGWAEKL